MKPKIPEHVVRRHMTTPPRVLLRPPPADDPAAVARVTELLAQLLDAAPAK